MSTSLRPDAVRYIVLHCSATRSNTTYTAWQLDQDHRQRGFRCAGYHFYVRRSGEIVALRELNQVGAHTLGYNRCSVGICYEGGLAPDGRPADTRTEEQRRALRYLVHILREQFAGAEVVGHRDLSPDRNGDGRIDPSEWLKACPSFDARAEYALPTPSRTEQRPKASCPTARATSVPSNAHTPDLRV